MLRYINIVVAVDSIGAFSDGKLNDNIFLMDNSPCTGSGQGTANLSTLCHPGQVIQWVIYPIDLQTQAMIKNITFIGTDNNSNVKHKNNCMRTVLDMPTLNSWTGIVPWYMVPGLPYRYRLEIQMGEGKNSIMYTDTPSLVRI
ncbi:MAG: hypothetical protein KAW12_15380 [Candidatus Aminicenantes bacterium]|nr:hypothetical protein [Candidatus Aminicenantes bacterium]